MPLQTLSLIGMPGAGKSTVGVLAAKRLGLNFIDGDIAIQVREGATLQHILEERGYLALRQVEEEVLCALNLRGVLLSTGGSAVYSEKTMARLGKAGPVVFLDAPLEVLQGRVANEEERGIARPPGQSFEEVYRERTPLYRRYAQIRIDVGICSAEAAARLLVEQVGSL